MTLPLPNRRMGLELARRVRGTKRSGEQAASDSVSEVAAADYLRSFLPEMVRVADRGGLSLVAYFLDMARITALEESGALKQKTGEKKPGNLQ